MVAGSTDNLIEEIDTVGGFRIIGDAGRNRQITSAGTLISGLTTNFNSQWSGGAPDADGNSAWLVGSGNNIARWQLEPDQNWIAGTQYVLTIPRDVIQVVNAITYLIFPAGDYVITPTSSSSEFTSNPVLRWNTSTMFPITEGIIGINNIMPTLPPERSTFIGSNGTGEGNTLSAVQTTTETSQVSLHVRTPSNNEFLVTDAEIEMRNAAGALGFRFDITTGDLDIAGEVRANSAFPDPTP